MIHALADSNGVETIWADEDDESQTAQMMQAREIIRNNYLSHE